MGVFCDRLEFGSTAALICRTGQNKGRYCQKELLLLLVSLSAGLQISVELSFSLVFMLQLPHKE